MPEAFKLLAGPQLWSLNCLAMLSVGQGPQCLPDLGSLTELTRLELTEFHYPANWPPLQNARLLRLIELVLVSCPHVPEALFVPGALSSLQRLHIEDDYNNYDQISDYYDDPPDSEADDPIDSGSEETEPELLMTQRHQKLQRIGETVLSLKSLYQVSGRAYLLLFGMAESLVKWQRFDYKEYSMSSLDYEAHKFLWLKPDAL